MPRKSPLSWPATAARLLGTPPRRGGRISHTCRRSPRFEPLEDRRLLAIIVNTLVDENNGIGVGGASLREAIAIAPSGETIEFAPALTQFGPATIRLGLGELLINKSLTIIGPGAGLLTIDASGNDSTPSVNEGNGSRVFRITDGTNNLQNVTIRRLTLTGGDSSGAGGGILVRENLTLVDCIVTGNATNTNAQLGGGGIYSATTDGAANTLTLTGCTISHNFAIRDEGGGVRKRYGSLVIERCLFNGNTASTYGGGLSAADGGISIQIRDSTFSANAATQFSGGGLYLDAANLTLANSTVSGNTAGWGAGVYLRATSQGTVTSSELIHNAARVDGGGLGVNGSQLTLANCTISGNTAGGYGGGGFVRDGTLTIRHGTVTANRANADSGGNELGGGVALSNTSTLTLDHSIVAGNLRAVATRSDLSGAVAARFSLIGDNTNAAIVNNGGNLIGTASAPIDARLDLLAHNGGPTLTHALLANSPAIDAGDPLAMVGLGTVPTYDQRGATYGRVVDGDANGTPRIDMGALESQYVPPALRGDFHVDGLVNGADYVAWRHALGSSATPFSGADGDGDGTVDQDDLVVWRRNFGRSLLGLGSSSPTGQATAAIPIGSAALALSASSRPTSAGHRAATRLPFERAVSQSSEQRDKTVLAWYVAHFSSGIKSLSQYTQIASKHSAATASGAPSPCPFPEVEGSVIGCDEHCIEVAAASARLLVLELSHEPATHDAVFASWPT